MPGWELIGEAEREAVTRLFDADPAQALVNKTVVREFEQGCAAALCVPEAVAVCNGTAALKTGLKALGIGPGDEVITQAHTFVATVEAIVDVGATPVIAEIDDTLNMDPTDVARKITPRTKALLPVHMLGAPCDMTAVMDLAQRHRLFVVEDTAQAFLGSYHGWALGTIGDVGCFSFSYSKLLTTGEGGLVICRDHVLLARARAYHDHGHDSNPSAPSRGQDTHTNGGMNYRMSALHAAVGLAQLAKVEESLKVHRAHAHHLRGLLRARLPGVVFRRSLDEAGDIGDAVVLLLDTETQAQRVARWLFEQDGIRLKNLPDALNWHDAGLWEHLLGPQADTLGRSGAILRRAVALQVCYRWGEADITQVADAVVAAVKGAL